MICVINLRTKWTASQLCTHMFILATFDISIVWLIAIPAAVCCLIRLSISLTAGCDLPQLCLMSLLMWYTSWHRLQASSWCLDVQKAKYFWSVQRDLINVPQFWKDLNILQRNILNICGAVIVRSGSWVMVDVPCRLKVRSSFTDHISLFPKTRSDNAPFWKCKWLCAALLWNFSCADISEPAGCLLDFQWIRYFYQVRSLGTVLTTLLVPLYLS